MKTNLKNLSLRVTLIAVVTVAWVGRVAAQDDAILYFLSEAGVNSPNIGGAWPTVGLVQSSNVLYGLTAAGGSQGGGTLFSIGTNGTAFADRYDFAPDPRRTDGKYPKYGLVLCSNMLYGTTYYGGSLSNGSVFSVRTNGSGFTILHSFDGTNGMRPSGNLALFNNTLYGTTEAGGGGSPTNGGTVFSIHTDGTGFATVHDFLMQGVNFNAPLGAWPKGGVILSASGTTLYGTTQIGGTYTNGTVFAVNTDGSGFSVYHSFQPSPLGYYSPNIDGCWPMAGLVLSPAGDTLYGTTYAGGAKGYGTVFAIGANGGGFRTVQDFPAEGAPGAYGPGVGVRSISPLVFSANGKVLYGTAVLIPGGDATPWIAGITAGGTVFGLATSGSPIGIMWTCGSYYLDSHNADGSIPDGVVRLGKALYGTMTIGGVGDGGIVYRLGLGLGATVKAKSPHTATPLRASLGETITVEVTVLNRDEENISNVRLAGPITVYSNGVVAAAGFKGPTMKPVLAPLTKTTFTYQYTATNYGTVNFTAAATGVGADGVVTSVPWTSDNVVIAPNADLMVKSADPKDKHFRGAGEYQEVASGDQIVTQPVGTNGNAAYIVRLQNNDKIAQSCVLQGITNNVANWAVKVLAGNVNISDALISATGWATPMLAPTGHLDLQVSLAPLPKAGMNDNKSILIKAWDDTGTTILDAVSLHAKLVPIPVKVTINAVSAPDAALSGYTPESIQAGMTDINAPLVPNVDPAELDPALAQMAGGLVADGVTPLVIKLETNPSDFSQLPNGLDFVFEADILDGGSLKGDPMAKRLALLRNGVWQSATNVLLSATNPIAYVQLRPLLSDDLSFTGFPPELLVDFIVKDHSANFAGDAQFKLRKPPIALIHGYASSGDWGAEFKAILGNSRPYLGEGNPGNFVITVKYGQDEVPGLANSVGKLTPLGPVYVNTMATLKECAQMVERELRYGIGPLHATWAFTRYDVVCHSQGGLLARMLCSASPPNTIISDPFKNAANCNRGRFHRAVTIGSPHNGSRILHYLLALEAYQQSFRGQMDGTGIQQLVAEGMILSKMAQKKFDPFGDQIMELNGNSEWLPDPDARFHLVRAVIDNGFCPTFPDATLEYQLLALANSAGGAAVIPRGSDGVVDLDSMGLGRNVFTVQAANNISHAGPLWVFGADSFEVASTVIAQHVIGALDQVASMNPNDMVFDRFPMPPLLNGSQKTLIDNYASSSAFWQTAKDALTQLAHPLDGDTSYQYQVLFPANLPPLSDVAWSVQVYDAAGITSDGVVITPWGTNNSCVTVSVDNALVGDVVLSAVYLSVSNTVVVIPSALVVSLAPSGGTLTGFQLLPTNNALPVGATVSPQLLATYSDGSSSLRYAAPGTVTAVSSQPSVVSVDDPLNWQLSAVGSAQISVTWSGFTAHSQITVFDPASSTPPTLSLQTTSDGQLAAAWAGFQTAYVLESTGNLQQTNSWQPVATAPLSGGGWTTVPLAMTNAQQFFRLRWDPSAMNF